jgi:putative glutamine amidotransferase
MPLRIAIPVPTSSDEEYNRRSLGPYLTALEASGAQPVVVPLDESQEEVAKLLRDVDGILLPGSRFDIDPQRFGEERIPECGEADPARTAVDELLLQDAFSLQKPILAICHGAQSLNVWRSGSLIQDLKTAVNHRPGREVARAHAVRIAAGSRLASLVPEGEGPEPEVNSSHHQAIRGTGDNLVVTAVSPVDEVVEGVELDSPAHFAVGVQWHPERTYAQSEFSRAIFRAFVRAARERRRAA